MELFFPRKPGRKDQTVCTPEVVEFVENCNTTKPSTPTTKMQWGLIEKGIYAMLGNVPVQLTFGDILTKEFEFYTEEAIVLSLKNLKLMKILWEHSITVCHVHGSGGTITIITII